MERVTGFEPVTSTLARLRSSQLSYTRVIGKFTSIIREIQLFKWIAKDVAICYNKISIKNLN